MVTHTSIGLTAEHGGGAARNTDDPGTWSAAWTISNCQPARRGRDGASLPGGGHSSEPHCGDQNLHSGVQQAIRTRGTDDLGVEPSEHLYTLRHRIVDVRLRLH